MALIPLPHPSPSWPGTWYLRRRLKSVKLYVHIANIHQDYSLRYEYPTSSDDYMCTVLVNQVTGENCVPDLQVAIDTLNSAVHELLAISAVNCHPASGDSGDSITDPPQLVLAPQSPDYEIKCNTEEIRDLVNNLMDTLTSTGCANGRAVRNINGFHEHKDEHYDEYTPTPLVHSCEEIKTNWPDSPSKLYTIADSGGHTRHVYCHMEELCGSDEGWMRVAYLNMADPFEKCPEGFGLYKENGVRACCRPSTSSGSCVSTTYRPRGISYSQVCGKVIGYQFGSTDGINNNDINGPYIDGISLTHGNPRNHIWSFIAGYQESVSHSGCPCGTVNRKSSSSFVGNNYFCESAVPFPMEYKFYPNDLLWDGKGCGSIEEPCCWVPGLPWFQKTLGYTTTDYIEMRLCCDEGTNNEDVLMSHVELYIR